ncbi:hypothetical protein M5D96_013155 [Drosophila gunungcola]|uniref:Secreted protein n=1 Tax=Drosophila gunungcola TaxID=103775 RepID=A0A9P9YCM2_9MUSC|nr:hypothetical protein M5D96_013155 [Drosophila gunungcola]
MIIWTMMMMMVMPQTFRGINTNGKISDPRSQILMPTSSETQRIPKTKTVRLDPIRSHCIALHRIASDPIA